MHSWDHCNSIKVLYVLIKGVFSFQRHIDLPLVGPLGPWQDREGEGNHCRPQLEASDTFRRKWLEVKRRDITS